VRATLFKDGLEFKFEVNGERWLQGATIEGELFLKNHRPEVFETKKLNVRLCWGDFKKVKTRDAKAFTPLSSTELSTSEILNSGEEKSWKWSIKLEDNCPISEKNGSLYLLFGDEVQQLGGDLQLNIDPKEVYKEIIKLMENFLRFKMKDISSKKGLVTAKFAPPLSKDFSSVDSLLMSFALEQQELKLHYEFKVKRVTLGATNTDLKMAKDVSQLEQKLDPKRYLIGKSLDQDFVLKQLQAAIDTVKLKSMF